MFPRFDKACHADVNAFASALTDAGFVDGPTAAGQLQRICRLWRDGSRVMPLSAACVTTVESPAQPAWYLNLARVLHEAPLRDRVLAVFEKFVENAAGRTDAWTLFEQTPRSLDVLARIACGSPFLTQTLLADPESLAAVTADGRTAEMKSRNQFIQEAREAASGYTKRPTQLRLLRRYQRRELLRIGMCDAFGLLDLRFVTLQLSLLADAMVQVCLDLAAQESGVSGDQIAVLALGKHGGEELNYSSDIDLILMARHDSPDTRRLARLCIEGLSHDLPPGFLYRVDLRLRPWGDAGSLLCTPETLADYLRLHAETWEKQAMLKARAVAGDPELGRSTLHAVQPLLFTGSASMVRSEIHRMKDRIESRLRQRGKLQNEVKLGAGSIRDIEFLVQYLQLTHGRSDPRILSCNTLESLARLAEFGMLSAAWYRKLRAGYVFLRTVEHSLQLLHNQQTHELPQAAGSQEWLAHRLDFPDADTLLQRFEEHRLAVRSIFEECLSGDFPGGSRNLPNTAHPPADRTASDTTEIPRPGLAVFSGKPEISQADRVTSDDRTPMVTQSTFDRLAAEVEQGAAVAVHCEFHQEHSGLLQVVLCGVEFSGWLATVCGLLSVYRLDIRSGDVRLSSESVRHSRTSTPGRFLAVFDVHPGLEVSSVSEFRRITHPASHGGDPRTAGLSPCAAEPDARSIPELLTRRLQNELTDMEQRVRNGQSESVQSELMVRFCDDISRPAWSVAGQEALTIEIHETVPEGETRLDITSPDTRGFLFELSHALAVSGFRIARATIDSAANQVRDVLSVTESDGSPVSRPHRLQHLKTAVTLIRQFAQWLPFTGDPVRAIRSFRELLICLRPKPDWSETLQSLQRPGVLQAVASVLGISPFLWDDLLKPRHDEFFPLIAHGEELALRVDRHALAAELDSALGATADRASRWSALNVFKDRQLFRIDVRHLLGFCGPFGEFSVEITELADLIVTRAVRLARDQLVADHGVPVGRSSDRPCQFSVAGLGKFGGVEMGFASDIEIVLIYEEAGQTANPDAISCARFFDTLVSIVAAGISARQDGIFQVDLRMRPFGQAGSAALSLDDFEAYYRPLGAAWPYERQTLVRFRCVAGDGAFSRRVTETCHRLLYTPGSFDFAAMRGMRERQIRQLVRGGTINAKLSDGGLVDCEYAVQALQLTFGKHHAGLRHANTLTVLREAAGLSLIDPRQCSQVEQAYIFLRQLIDCLRMVRGNARDLTVPEPGTADYTQLERRLNTIHRSTIPLSQLESQMATIRDFSLAIDRHCRSLRSTAG